MDICFASLGHIWTNSPNNYEVAPWCVKGSLWAKREGMYSSNFADFIENEFEHTEEDSKENMKKRLYRAAKEGRHLANKFARDRDEARYDYFGDDGDELSYGAMDEQYEFDKYFDRK